MRSVMEYTLLNGYKISKLSLGTVALGLDYGISNTKGQPSKQQSFEVLSKAAQAGINTLDTARIYGSAEEVVGSYLHNAGKQYQLNVVSKFKLGIEHIKDYKIAKEEAFTSVQTSLEKLKLSKLPVCLLHMSRELDKELVLSHVPHIFEDLIEAQLIDMAGISIDHPRELEWFEKYPLFRAFQVPVNIFDHRLLHAGILNRVHAEGKLIFARSVFLQGLFFLNPGKLKGSLVTAKPYIEQLNILAAEEGLTVAEMAFSFIRHIKSVTSIVFGAEAAEQVYQNIKLLNVLPLSENTILKIYQLFGNVPEDIITPGNWKV